eukprot:scaffold9034_cov124-Isochrysis_galbana.AAC.6
MGLPCMPPPACAHPALLIALLTRTRPDMLAGVDADDEVAKASIASCWNGLYAVGSTLAPLASSYIYSFVGFARTCSVFAGFGMLVVVAMTLSATGGCRRSPHVVLKGARGSHGHLAEPLLRHHFMRAHTTEGEEARGRPRCKNVPRPLYKSRCIWNSPVSSRSSRSVSATCALAPARSRKRKWSVLPLNHASSVSVIAMADPRRPRAKRRG